MNDLSAFERRLAAGLDGLVGPRRNVDASRISRTAVNRASVDRSLLSLFSAAMGRGVRVGDGRVGDLGTTSGTRALVVFVVIALITALALGALAVGSGLVRMPSVVPLAPTSPPASTVSLPSATPAPVLGGGLVLATMPHPGDRPCNTTAAPFDVVTVDPGTGATTLLGTSASTCDVRPFDARWAADRTKIVLLERYGRGQLDLPTVTEAGREFPVVCCGLPTGVWEGGGPDNEQDWKVSPRGDQIAAIHTAAPDGLGDAIVVAEIDGQNARRVPLPKGVDPCCGFAWSPDESLIAVATSAGTLLIVPVDGSPIRVLVDGGAGAAPSQPAWAPDGTTIAVVVSRCPAAKAPPFCTTLATVDVATGAVESLLTGKDVRAADDEVWSPSWSPDGRRIGLLVSDPSFSGFETFAVDPEGANLAKVSDGRLLAWSPDGQWLLVGGGSDGEDVWIAPIAGGQERNLGRFQSADW